MTPEEAANKWAIWPDMEKGWSVDQSMREAFLVGATWAKQNSPVWVKVSEKKPEIPKPYYDKEDECLKTPLDVLIIVYDIVADMVFTFNYYEPTGFSREPDITHWQYLPEKPNESGSSPVSEVEILKEEIERLLRCKNAWGNGTEGFDETDKPL